MAKIPKKCPSCSADLVITRLSCPKCGTEVQGSFEPDLFTRLSPGDYDFIVLFIKTKGNIKEMERELGISYWTIRNKLNEIVAWLGLESAPPPEEEAAFLRQAILERLNRGEISVVEAAELLEQLKNRA
jgi:hypothetical protein